MLLLFIIIYKSFDLSGFITPVNMLINVVLPAPLCPNIPISSLGSIYRLKLLIA